MSASFNLPPNLRDFQAFQRIVIDQASTRQVARELEISQTRVRQIVSRITDWLQQNLRILDEKQQAARLQLAQHIASDRLDRYLREADQAWQLTQETKYANLALRLLTAQSKFPVLAGTLEALAADAIFGPLPDDTNSLDTVGTIDNAQPGSAQSAVCHSQSAIPSPPPLEDCSLPQPMIPSPVEKPTLAADASPSTPEPSDQRSAPCRAARSAFLSPAHLPLEPDDAPVAELNVTPQSLGFTPSKNLSRKDRRRMRRLAMAK